MFRAILAKSRKALQSVGQFDMVRTVIISTYLPCCQVVRKKSFYPVAGSRKMLQYFTWKNGRVLKLFLSVIAFSQP